MQGEDRAGAVDHARPRPARRRRPGSPPRPAGTAAAPGRPVTGPAPRPGPGRRRARAAAWRSWPQAWQTPGTVERYGTSFTSGSRSASMSPRSATSGPGPVADVADHPVPVGPASGSQARPPTGARRGRAVVRCSSQLGSGWRVQRPPEGDQLGSASSTSTMAACEPRSAAHGATRSRADRRCASSPDEQVDDRRAGRRRSVGRRPPRRAGAA